MLNYLPDEYLANSVAAMGMKCYVFNFLSLGIGLLRGWVVSHLPCRIIFPQTEYGSCTYSTEVGYIGN